MIERAVQWLKRLVGLRPLEEKVVEAIEKDVLDAIMVYAKSRLRYYQIPAFTESLNGFMKTGGVHLRDAVEISIARAQNAQIPDDLIKAQNSVDEA